MSVEIQDTKEVWVAWTNTDLTEGKGYKIPLHVTESYETALRLGRGGSVMGANCEVTNEMAVKVNNRWLIPGYIVPESLEDMKLRIKREEKEAALERAKQAGLSEEDIAALSSN